MTILLHDMLSAGDASMMAATWLPILAVAVTATKDPEGTFT